MKLIQGKTKTLNSTKHHLSHNVFEGAHDLKNTIQNSLQNADQHIHCRYSNFSTVPNALVSSTSPHVRKTTTTSLWENEETV